ncbi:hypothetical protein FIBSPDRAFT_868041 [Athelia psychrophila]|uniref:Uncharacterized protein n=1 Tax=Athelia psychrophila TaxID=1759441 RepID=A0A166DFG9_9AGAM|nr:hypothetical protein FIBSPDRAFT_868041 [Fibularhizoctonia sp. CBS 109695]
MAESNGVDAIRSILHERSRYLLRSRIVSEAEVLAIQGHLSLANQVLNTLFFLLKPTWPGNVPCVCRIGWETMWLESQSPLPNAPPAYLPLTGPQHHRILFYRSIGISSMQGTSVTSGITTRWREITNTVKQHMDSSQSEIRAHVLPMMDRMHQRFPSNPESPLDVEDGDIYAAFVALYIDTLLRVGDLDAARAILNSRVRTICRKCHIIRQRILSVPGICALLQEDDPDSLDEVVGNAYALLAALTIRVKDGVVRPYAHLPWDALIGRFLASAKKRYPSAIGRLTDQQGSNAPAHAPACEANITAMVARVALDTPLPADYLAFLRHADGIKGVHPSHVLGSAAQVRVETWTGVSKLRVECDQQELLALSGEYEAWPLLKRVVAIDANLSNAGDIWLVEPWLMAQARQFALDAGRRKQAREEGADMPAAGESPASCPKPRGKDMGLVFRAPTHEASNLPPEIIEMVVSYALRDVSGCAYERETALALCGTSRRMHELSIAALWQTGWTLMTWSSWGINLDVYDSFRHYIEIQTRRNEEHVPFTINSP